MIDPQREAFEKWANPDSIQARRDAEGNYLDRGMAAAWSGWQVALASQKQEPVAWKVGSLAFTEYLEAVQFAQANMLPVQELYTTPPSTNALIAQAFELALGEFEKTEADENYADTHPGIVFRLRTLREVANAILALTPEACRKARHDELMEVARAVHASGELWDKADICDEDLKAIVAEVENK